MENNNRQGCRWTKPKDKLPEYLKKGFSKMSDYVPVRIYDDYEKRVIYSTARYCHDRKMWFDIMHNSENNCVINPIEWYNPESIEPCATSSENDELWDELADYIDDFTLDDNMSMGELKSKLKQAYSITRKSGDRDCEELKKEVERLKGLIKQLYTMYNREVMFPDKLEKHWQQFEKENKL